MVFAQSSGRFTPPFPEITDESQPIHHNFTQKGRIGSGVFSIKKTALRWTSCPIGVGAKNPSTPLYINASISHESHVAKKNSFLSIHRDHSKKTRAPKGKTQALCSKRIRNMKTVDIVTAPMTIVTPPTIGTILLDILYHNYLYYLLNPQTRVWGYMLGLWLNFYWRKTLNCLCGGTEFCYDFWQLIIPPQVFLKSTCKNTAKPPPKKKPPS